MRRSTLALAGVTAGAGLLYVLAWAGGEEGIGWKSAGKLPDRLDVKRVWLTGETSGIVAGTLPGDPSSGPGPKEKIEAERAVIFRSTDGGTNFVQALESPGSMIAVDFCDDKHGWAVVARPRESGEGSYYFLVSTQDGGASWREVGGIPAQSVTQVVRAGVDRGWVMGANTLLRTTDTGSNWTPGTAPGKRNAASERIVVDGPEGLLILGKGSILRTQDGGANWQVGVIEGGARAQVARGGWAVVGDVSGAVFGRLDGVNLAKAGDLPAGIRADALVVEGQVVRIVAASGAGGETVILTSGDAGAHFRVQSVPVPASAHVGLFGPRAGWAVTLDRTVLAGP